MNTAIRLVESGYVPRPLVRFGIRRLLRRRLREQEHRFARDPDAAMDAWLERMRRGPVAPVPEKANEQHYELPPEFFRAVLGRRLKYSSAYFPPGVDSLDEAEEAMLELTCRRAGLGDGQRILELGCGWGSLSLWMAEHYPRSRILAVSNSAPQREYIQARARERGLRNLDVATHDMNAFETARQLDRIVSVEMFEHMRNWEELLQRASRWLDASGRLFVHVFAHREFAYPFETQDDSDWMARYFFTGGMMPSDDLLERVDSPFDVERHWVVDGTHYARTAEGWLENLDAARAEVLPILERTYGRGEAERWLERWRVFFLACAELFGYRGGREWWVSHYRLQRRSDGSGAR